MRTVHCSTNSNKKKKVKSPRQQKQKLRITNRKLHFGSFYKLSHARMRQVHGQREKKKNEGYTLLFSNVPVTEQYFVTESKKVNAKLAASFISSLSL
ncbi:hypothetical protein MUK42_36101 [Musa troglodytarum]|uniref:Uncharacterized protein n=1 Tax=Musa troglodytarum TaxID=320322 RepID=A0A9E7G8M0_9LILI|nr:hypothetical protein MUK42_36101 [Musa troglodytarum]